MRHNIQGEQTNFNFWKKEHIDNTEIDPNDTKLENYQQWEIEPIDCNDENSTQKKMSLPIRLNVNTQNLCKDDNKDVSAPCDYSDLLRYNSIWHILANYYANPMSTAINSNTMLLPHQVQAASRVLSQIRPRFLIADEVGLGKTIEAGLIIKELILKHNYSKILICVPSPLLYQWQAELSSKFNEDFKILNSKMLKESATQRKTEKLLGSIDLVKDPEYRDFFRKRKFDVVIFDEAHRLRRDLNKITRAYQFAEYISGNCLPFEGALLLMSATPFRGKLEEIYFLIRLLDRDILGPMHSFMNKYRENNALGLKESLSSVIIRRRKIDIGGFTKRFARTVKYELSKSERIFYDATCDFVRREYNLAMSNGNRFLGFVLIIFQKLLDSSAYALLKALEKRKARLEEVYNNLMRGDYSIVATQLNVFDENEDCDEELVDLVESINPLELRQEIEALNRLIQLGSSIQKDEKLEITKETLREIFDAGHEKVIIFTQFKRTMEFVASHLKERYVVDVFHGGLSARHKEDTISHFQEQGEVLICTEAGGEGRNLQQASALINYDLPWSPVKVEQRIGRIHRFGQKRDVHIINFASKDTVAEKILEILTDKIELFENAFGPSDTLLGTLDEDKSFSNTILKFLKMKKSKKEKCDELEKSMNMARNNEKKLNHLLSPEFLDFNMNAFSSEEKSSIAKVHEAESILEKIVKESLTSSSTHHFTENSKGEIIVSEFESEKKIRGHFYNKNLSEKYTGDYLAIGHSLVDNVISSEIYFIENQKSSIFEVHGFSSRGIGVHFDVVFQFDRHYQRFFSLYIDEDLKKSFTVLPNDSEEASVVQIHPTNEIIRSLIDKLKPEISRLVAEEEMKIRNRIKQSALYWSGKFHEAEKNSKTELDEKLAIQKGKAKWYGERPMAGVIKRTMNDISKTVDRKYRRISAINHIMQDKIELKIKNIIIFERRPK